MPIEPHVGHGSSGVTKSGRRTRRDGKPGDRSTNRSCSSRRRSRTAWTTPDCAVGVGERRVPARDGDTSTAATAAAAATPPTRSANPRWRERFRGNSGSSPAGTGLGGVVRTCSTTASARARHSTHSSQTSRCSSAQRARPRRSRRPRPWRSTAGPSRRAAEGDRVVGCSHERVEKRARSTSNTGWVPLPTSMDEIGVEKFARSSGIAPRPPAPRRSSRRRNAARRASPDSSAAPAPASRRGACAPFSSASASGMKIGRGIAIGGVEPLDPRARPGGRSAARAPRARRPVPDCRELNADRPRDPRRAPGSAQSASRSVPRRAARRRSARARRTDRPGERPAPAGRPAASAPRRHRRRRPRRARADRARAKARGGRPRPRAAISPDRGAARRARWTGSRGGRRVPTAGRRARDRPRRSGSRPRARWRRPAARSRCARPRPACRRG